MSSTLTDPITATAVFTYPSQESISPFTTLVTWTNLGPLTTTFTAPASCSSTPLGQLVASSDDLLVSGWCSTLPSWLDCEPYGAEASSLFSVNSLTFWETYQSPGLHCPTGFITANSLTLAESDLLTSTLNGDTLSTTGTHVFCCPSGYSSSTQLCVSPVTTATSTSLCNYLESAQTTTVVGADGSTQTSTIIVASPFSWTPANQDVTLQLQIDPVYMIHQQSDVPRNGLSTASKIAIGVVVPVVVLTAVIVGILCFRNRQRKSRQPKSNAAYAAVPLNPLSGRGDFPQSPVPTKRKWHWI